MVLEKVIDHTAKEKTPDVRRGNIEECGVLTSTPPFGFAQGHEPIEWQMDFLQSRHQEFLADMNAKKALFNHL
jgi:hypothetical protein